MKKLFYTLILLVILSGIVLVIFRGNGNARHPADGIYFGILPGADSPGIETTLTISGKAYKLRTKYQKNVQPNTFTVTGNIVYEGRGVIRLDGGTKAKETEYYKVLNKLELLKLDSKAQVINSAHNYILRRGLVWE